MVAMLDTSQGSLIGALLACFGKVRSKSAQSFSVCCAEYCQSLRDECLLMSVCVDLLSQYDKSGSVDKLLKEFIRNLRKRSTSLVQQAQAHALIRVGACLLFPSFRLYSTGTGVRDGAGQG